MLDGTVHGQIVDRSTKEAMLREWAERNQIPLTATIAAGDGANDLDLLGAAGLGVAFNAKPALREHAAVKLDFPDLEVIADLVLGSAVEEGSVFDHPALDTPAAAELAALYAAPPTAGDLERTVDALERAGGRDWAQVQAADRMSRAVHHLSAAIPRPPDAGELLALAEYVTRRTR